MVQGDGDGSGWDYAAYDFRFGICCGKRRYGFAALSLYQKHYAAMRLNTDETVSTVKVSGVFTPDSK